MVSKKGAIDLPWRLGHNDFVNIIVTGAAGFIGSFVSKRLLEAGHTVLGLDNLNDYYDVRLKESRLEFLRPFDRFQFLKLDIADRESLANAFKQFGATRVVHLAAQAGVRYSVTNPHAYADSNLVGFLNILEACRQNKMEHLVYASTSSVYGLNHKLPFSPRDPVDHPASLYAATKRANELMAHSYSHMFHLPTTGLRFFTVYGPYGRPDMALFKFTKAILNDEPIEVYNGGKHIRDFTYVDDIAEGVVRVALGKVPQGTSQSPSLSDRTDPSRSSAPFRIYNIGNSQPVELNVYIETLEAAIGKKAKRIHLPLQDGDIVATSADVTELVNDYEYKPATSVTEGVKRFVEWYKEYNSLLQQL